MDLRNVNEIVDRYQASPAALLAILQDIQKRENWLPREAIERVAQRLEVPLTRVYGMATFFRSFSLKPRGKHICTVCLGTACHVRGAPKIVEKLERDLKICAGGTTPDMNVTLETVNCVGACALGPLVILDGTYHGNISSAKLDKVMQGVTGRAEK